ncbi:MAG: fatty acyl-AMP ligase [Myxococcales bacterium]|nr:fatty acyl-AMP ligase [Myxococcales bacterium]
MADRPSSKQRNSRRFRSSFPDVVAADFRTGAWASGVPGVGERLEVLHATTVDALASAARHGGKTGVTMYTDDEDEAPEHRTYAELWGQVKRVAASLASRGVLAGDRVLIVTPTSFEFLTTFFAVQRLGAIAVPSYPPAALERVETGLERIAHIGNHATVEWCVTTKSLRPVLGDLGLRIKTLRRISAAESLLDDTSDAEAVARPLPPPEDIGPFNPCFIQYTSGSTGNPKGVLLSHENVTSNIHAMGQALQLGRKDSIASWLPLYHDMGLIGGVLSAVYWRIPLALMPPTAFLMRPVRWLRMFGDHGATLSPAPNFAYALATKRVRPSEREGLDLSSWRLALNGAEPVSHTIVKEFVEAFAPYGFKKESVYPVYGLAESSLAVTFPRPGEPLRVQRVDRRALASGEVIPSEGEGSTELVCVGRPMPAHEVVVVGSEGEPLDDEEVGHVVVRGPSVMRGYFKDGERTNEVIRDGWLWTGDLGYTSKGGLYVTGRAKDLIIVRGKNYYAEDLERVAEAVPGLRPGGVVAFAIYDDVKAKDTVVCVCETKITEAEERQKLAATVVDAVAEGAGLTVDEVVLVAPGTIPKTSSGKRQRSLTRDRYLDDDLTPKRTGKLKLAQVFARSAAGLITMLSRQMRGGRSAPP